MVLIITSEVDPHADIVISALKRKGACYTRLNTDEAPEQASRTVRFSRCSFTYVMESSLGKVNLDDVRVVWNRRHSRPRLPEGMSQENQEFAWKESRHFSDGLWHLLGDRYWINGIQSTEAAEAKPYQLSVAQSVGFEIPRTLMTNDPAEAVVFFDECEGRVVYKTFNQLARRNQDGTAVGVYTTPVRRDDLLERFEGLRIAPCIFQEHVEKQTELRITVIGNRMFTAEIDTRNSVRARNDWRHYDYKNTIYRPYALPESVSELVRRLMLRLKLVFGCIDMVVTPDHRFVFLEINAMGQWLWIEQRTQMPLLAHFTEMLIHGSEAYAEPESPLSLLSVTKES